MTDIVERLESLAGCPYCGSDTRLNKYSKRIGKAAPHVFKSAQVKCKRNSCGMAGPIFKGAEANEKAMRHWNGCVFHPTMRKAQTPLETDT